MEVTESRTFRFKGSFSYAYRTFPGDSWVSFSGFRISEGGMPYSRSESKEPGTYRVIQKENRTEVRWYFRAKNETRTFQFDYRAENAVLRYIDAARLYYQFISREWTLPCDSVSVTITPPVTLEKEQIQHWLHGPLWAFSRTTGSGEIQAYCAPLPARTYLEISALYPEDIFPGALLKPEEIRDKVLQEEAQAAIDANLERERLKKEALLRSRRMARGKWAAGGVTLAGIFIWISLFRRYGKRPSAPPISGYTGEIPERTPPALLSYLLYSQNVSGPALTATLLDLAQRGFLKLREEATEKKTLFGGTRVKKEYFWDRNPEMWQNNRDQLSGEEIQVIRFFYDHLAGGADTIGVKLIRKKSQKVMKFFQKWQKGIKALGQTKSWYDTGSLKGRGLSMGLSGLLLLLTIGFAFLFGPWAVLTGAACLIIFVLSFAIVHRTESGESLARRWKAYRRYLRKFRPGQATEALSVDQVNHALIYGTILGIGNRQMKEMIRLIPSESAGTWIPWYVYHGPAGTGFTPDAFASAFSSTLAAVSSAMSSASGAGGGATGAGGGGASSGGGGAG
jgi:uncharacterized membrane protein